jgi:type II secretory pathway pseudopilin PulG
MKRKCAGGFTLLEALIASTVFFICVSVVVMAFTAGSRNFRASKETIRAFQDTHNILDMITTELREANPAVSSGFNVGPTSVTFQKYNKPAQEIQTVTWSYLSGQKKIQRTYTSPNNTDTLFFGQNIEDLLFSQETAMRNGIEYKKVTVSMRIMGTRQTTSGGREILTMARSVNLRRDQVFEADIMFTNP